MTTTERPLSPLQARFVAEYQKDRNGTQAAIRAGANPNSAHVSASKWLKMPKIQAALGHVTAKALAKVEVKRAERKAVDTATYIIEKAAEIVDYGTEYVPVRSMFGSIITDEDGNAVTEMRDPKLVVPALTLLSKRHQEFRETAHVDQSQHIHLEGVSVEDLKAMLGQAKALPEPS